TLRILRREDEVNERAMAFLTLSRLMAVVADTALLAVPSSWAKDVFEQRYAAALRAALTQAVGRETSFEVTIDESLLLSGADEEDPPATRTPATAPRRETPVDTAVDNPPLRRADAASGRRRAEEDSPFAERPVRAAAPDPYEEPAAL